MAVLTVNNEVVTVFSNKDVCEIIEKYCGDDTARYVRQQFEELTAAADYTEQRIYTDLDAYESEIENLRASLEDAQSKAEKFIYDYERGEHLTKADAIAKLREIYEFIKGVL